MGRRKVIIKMLVLHANIAFYKVHCHNSVITPIRLNLKKVETFFSVYEYNLIILEMNMQFENRRHVCTYISLGD